MTPECLMRERLSALVDGDLTAPEEEAVRAHLAEDPPCGCRQELRSLEALVRDLRRLPVGPAPPGGWERLEARLGGARRRMAWAAAAAAVAGAAALWLAGISPWGTLSSGRTAGPRTMPAPTLLAAAAGARLPPLQVPDDLVVRYAVEIGPVDRLLAALREVPPEAADDDVDIQIARLDALRRDLLVEMVLQAEARGAAPWR